MSIFQKSVVNKYIRNLDYDKVNEAYKKFQEFYGDKLRLHNIMQLKEENYQEGFLREIFVQTLGYTINPDKNYNLTTEYKNQNDSRKADGAILKDGKAIAVIELKSTKTKDLESIKEQAFGYKVNQSYCKYVITSNFQSIRFYIDNATEYEEFNLFNLSESDFNFLYLLLSKESIFNQIPDKLKQETKFHEEKISDKLYKDYQNFKSHLFENLVKDNIQYDKLTLFKKSQKLLDRFLFIFFAEDSGLIPPNATDKMIEQWKQLQELEEYRPLYNRFQLLFKHLDKGHTYKKWGKIPAYNGGLFLYDEILDNQELKIPDGLLQNHIGILSAYDFNSEIDVNILGHIFEHSLNEFEEITEQIQGENIDKIQNKRKKDGIFYTPEYITQYIVKNTVGTLCNEKKEEFKIKNLLIDDSYRKKDGKLNKKGKKLFDTFKNYKDWLFTLKILDHACGSGAFLNQTLTFLITEHKLIDNLFAELTGDLLRMHDTDKFILENNIFGVDINEESVEIAKLSLWLRTAQRGRTLSDLSDNIKCGNSLISNPDIAPKNAFDWNTEFNEIINNGGFDVVIGNPPYGADIKKQADYLRKTYTTFTLSGESYVLFTEKSINLLRENGRLGFIIPDTYLNLDFTLPLRNFLLKNSNIEKIVLLPTNVFNSATVDTTNLILQKKPETKTFHENNVDIKLLSKKSGSIEWDNFNRELQISTKIWAQENAFLINSDNNEIQIINKVDQQFGTLGTIAEMYSGIKCYELGKGIPAQTEEMRDSKPYTSIEKKESRWQPFLEGKHIDRYKLLWNYNSWINYGEWLAAPRNKQNFEGEKILIRKIVNSRLIANYVSFTSYCNTLLFVLKLRDKSSVSYKSLLGVLNSNFIGWYYKHKFQISNEDTFPQIMIRDILKFPIPTANQQVLEEIEKKVYFILTENENLKLKSEKFLKRVKANLSIKNLSIKLQNFHEYDFKTFINELKKQKLKLRFNEQDEWEEYFDSRKMEIVNLQKQIKEQDKEIDQIVYKLYKLTTEEIEIINRSAKKN